MRKTTVVFLWMKMMMAVHSEVLEHVSVSMGGTVELRAFDLGPSLLSNPGEAAPEADVRWSGPALVLHRNRTSGCRGRCQLLPDGALRLTDAKLTDEGRYRQEVYDLSGRGIRRKELTLTVFGQSARSEARSKARSKAGRPVSFTCVLVLLFIIIIILLIIRRRQATNQSTVAHLEENHYVPMCRAKEKQIQTKQPEEDIYV